MQLMKGTGRAVRAVRKAKTMRELTIYIDTSDEAMVGGTGWEDCDAQASVDEFLDQVLAKMQEVFPGVTITVTPTDHRNGVETDELAHDSDLEEHVRDLINRVWGRQEWYVEAC